MIPAAFDYFAPTTLREVLNLLNRHRGEAKVLAGGHSLIPLMKLRLAQPKYIIDLGKVSDLAYIREEDGVLAIGPMTTYYTLESSPLLREKYPALAEAASQVADLQVRNKGTIGGSLAHADPAADLPAVIVASEGQLKTASSRGRRTIDAHRFFMGTFSTILRDNEILTEIRLPIPPPRTGSSYQKFPNKASHFAIVGVAAFVTLDEQGRCQRVRIGVTGAGDRASRARASERLLEGNEPTEQLALQAAEKATQGIEFQSDIHASAEYRAHLTQVYTRRALDEAFRRAR